MPGETSPDTNTPKQDWQRPRNCHCLTMKQRACCYEQCDPNDAGRIMRKGEGWMVIGYTLVSIAIITIVMVAIKCTFGSGCFG